ncbi:Hypothetical protein I5071_68170 [Sandaracinus amylolyticus]|nr:Hypothetical protein I5071_68170 [Sandaracinus amylolyticus]
MLDRVSDDAFEREHLGGAQALYRERIASRPTFAALAGISGTLGVFATIGLAAGVSGDWQGLVGGGAMGALAAFLGLMSITHSVLRVIVTAREVVMHVGFQERRIPLASITRAMPATYDDEHRTRMVREGSGDFATITPGRKLVRIEYTDPTGAAKAAYVGSLQPEVLVEAIDRARGLTKGPRVRVAADAPEHELEEEASRASRSRQQRR